MKNKEFYKLLNKNRSKLNSGFTLTELLVAVIMSTFVIGALGFGLMQVLRLTQKGTTETAARNETSRTLDFISDEMRRAESIEVDKSASITGFTPLTKSNGAGVTTDIEPSLILNVPGVTSPIVYSVAPPQTNTWKGPLVIYRWGPQLDGNGKYTTTITSQALVDKVSDESQTTTCDGNSVSYQGFFACVVDDDGDGNTEVAKDTNSDGSITADDNPVDTNDDGSITSADGFVDTNGDGSITNADSVTDMNGDGVINLDDGADVDGKAITAQLYFTGGTTAADGSTSTYSADTKTVARARTAPGNNSEDLNSYSLSFKSLNPRFSCNSGSNTEWEMRTDFGDGMANTSAARSNLATWNHVENRQPQPIKIDDGKPLTITSIPREASNCLNTRANNGREADRTPVRDFSGNETLAEQGDWTADDTVVAISHSINFDDPRTFNGDIVCATAPCTNTDSGGDVLNYKAGAAASTTPNPFVKILKKGSTVPDYGGYDANKDGVFDSGDQKSLGEFLAEQGYAKLVGSTYIIENLEPSERIVAVEIGQTNISNTNPGADFQDNTFIVSSKAFEKKYSKYKDGDGNEGSYSPI